MATKKSKAKGLTKLSSRVNYPVFIPYGGNLFQLAPFEVKDGLETSKLGDLPPANEVRAYNY